MALAQSNLVDLYFSKETSWGETPSTPSMTGLPFTAESISFNKESVSSEQIRSDRQRNAVGLSDFSVEGDLNFEFQYNNYDLLLEGLLSNTFTTIALTSLVLTIVTSAKTVTRASGSFVSDGVIVGTWIKLGGLVNDGNNSIFKVKTVTALTLTLEDNTTGLVDETSVPGCTLDSKFIKIGSDFQSFLIEKRFTDISQYIYHSGMRVGSAAFNLVSRGNYER